MKQKLQQKPQKMEVRDALFRAPEPSDEHLRLPPSALKNPKLKFVKEFQFDAIWLLLLGMGIFWIGWNIFFFVGNLNLFYRG